MIVTLYCIGLYGFRCFGFAARIGRVWVCGDVGIRRWAFGVLSVVRSLKSIVHMLFLVYMLMLITFYCGWCGSCGIVFVHIRWLVRCPVRAVVALIWFVSCRGLRFCFVRLAHCHCSFTFFSAAVHSCCFFVVGVSNVRVSCLCVSCVTCCVFCNYKRSFLGLYIFSLVQFCVSRQI